MNFAGPTIEERRVPAGVFVTAGKELAGEERRLREEFGEKVSRFTEEIELATLTRAAREASMRWPDTLVMSAFSADWIERVGSDIEQAAGAIRVLIAGVRSWPSWIHFFPWLFGAIDQAKVETGADHAFIVQMEREAVQVFASQGHSQARLRERLSKPVVNHHLDSPFAALSGGFKASRWTAGNRYFDAHLASNRKLKSTLSRLGIEPTG